MLGSDKAKGTVQMHYFSPATSHCPPPTAHCQDANCRKGIGCYALIRGRGWGGAEVEGFPTAIMTTWHRSTQRFNPDLIVFLHQHNFFIIMSLDSDYWPASVVVLHSWFWAARSDHDHSAVLYFLGSKPGSSIMPLTLLLIRHDQLCFFSVASTVIIGKSCILWMSYRGNFSWPRKAWENGNGKWGK